MGEFKKIDRMLSDARNALDNREEKVNGSDSNLWPFGLHLIICRIHHQVQQLIQAYLP